MFGRKKKQDAKAKTDNIESVAGKTSNCGSCGRGSGEKCCGGRKNTTKACK